MATMSVSVRSGVPAAQMPYELSRSEDECETSITIRIPVPAGQSRYVQSFYDSGYTTDGTPTAAATSTQTINADTDVTVTLVGQSLTPLDDDEYIASVKVALSASDPWFYTSSIYRICDPTEICP